MSMHKGMTGRNEPNGPASTDKTLGDYVKKIMEREKPAEQKPVAWMDEAGRIYRHCTHDVEREHGLPLSAPLYASPQPAAPQAEPQKKLSFDEWYKRRLVDFDGRHPSAAVVWKAAQENK